jgi:hypothetical protein
MFLVNPVPLVISFRILPISTSLQAPDASARPPHY